jgi:leader peptidase (prepilin peptidase)/N-methyltransferase
LALFEVVQVPGATLPPLIAIVVSAWTFMVGSTIGSFLNVVIARVPEGQSVVRPRSRCPSCKTQIAWYDNVPIVSWLVLGGRCRTCKTLISARYMLVELLIGLMALAVFLAWGMSPRALEVFALSTMDVAVAFIDLDTWTIPHGLNAAIVVVAAFFAVLTVVLDVPIGAVILPDPDATANDALIARLLGAVLGFASLQAIRVISTAYFRYRGRIGPSEEAMGAGDPLLLGAIGAVLGYGALPLLIFLSSFQGAFVGLCMWLLGRLRPAGVPVEGDPEEWAPPSAAIPFGPFLALAAIEVAFFGPALNEVLTAWIFPF